MPPIRQLRELRPATMRASTSRFQSLAPHGPLAPLAELPTASRPNALPLILPAPLIIDTAVALEVDYAARFDAGLDE